MNGTRAPSRYPIPRGREGSPMGALLALFVIVGAELQRSWPSGTSLVYLAVCVPLLALWLAHLAGWTKAVHFAGWAIDLSICTLLFASLGGHFGLTGISGSALASTLLFWSPLIAVWWAWRYHEVSLRFIMMAGLLFLILAWQFTDSSQRFHEHLILAACLILLVRTVANDVADSAGPIGHDPASGLVSASYFEAELAQLAAISDRYQIPFSLVGCRFPATEQQQVTLHVADYANAVSDRLRVSDTACQWDKTTYLILLPNTRDDQARAVAHTIREALRAVPTTGAAPPIAVAWMQHTLCEDPMSTLNALEQKLLEPTH